MAGRIASGVPASIDRRTALLGAVASSEFLMAAACPPPVADGVPTSMAAEDCGARASATMGASEAEALAALYAEARAMQAEAERVVSDPDGVARSADLLAGLEQRALDVRVTTLAGAAAALEWVRADLLRNDGTTSGFGFYPDRIGKALDVLRSTGGAAL